MKPVSSGGSGWRWRSRASLASPTWWCTDERALIGPANCRAVLFPFLFTVVVVAIALRLLNAVPGYWEMLTAGPERLPPSLTERLQYSSIEEMQKELGVASWPLPGTSPPIWSGRPTPSGGSEIRCGWAR